MFGAESTVNGCEGALPPGVTTVIGPVEAPCGTAVSICVEEVTVNVVAAVPLKLTCVAPVKFAPVNVTDPKMYAPAAGWKELIEGGGMMRYVALAVPPAVMTC